MSYREYLESVHKMCIEKTKDVTDEQRHKYKKMCKGYPGIMGGNPVISGRRIYPENVAKVVYDGHLKIMLWDLTEEEIMACLYFTAENPISYSSDDEISDE